MPPPGDEPIRTRSFARLPASILALGIAGCSKHSLPAEEPPAPAATGATALPTSAASAPLAAAGAPRWGQEDRWTGRDPAAHDWFGHSVALSDDRALVGANFHTVDANAGQGAVTVLARRGTIWQREAVLTASDGGANDGFGVSVALSGTTALVGANAHPLGSNWNQGAAYVFVWNGTSWAQEAVLTALDGAAQDSFGRSVALSGDTALVGAHGHEIGTTAPRGLAYVFVRSGTTWTQQAKLTARDGRPGDDFGGSVALSTDTALIGAQLHAFGPRAGPGAAYVFTRSGTSWTEQATLTASDGAEGDDFGASVALSGSLALVGAFNHTVGSNAGEGAAYVFVQRGSIWTEQARLTARRGAANARFGASVALSGNTALVGAPPRWIGSPHGGPHAAHVFVQGRATWIERAELTSREAAERDAFGTSVALSGNTALVGASGPGAGPNAGQGAVVLFVESP